MIVSNSRNVATAAMSADMLSTAGTPTALHGANNSREATTAGRPTTAGMPTIAGMPATATPDIGNTSSRRDVSNSRDGY